MGGVTRRDKRKWVDKDFDVIYQAHTNAGWVETDISAFVPSSCTEVELHGYCAASAFVGVRATDSSANRYDGMAANTVVHMHCRVIAQHIDVYDGHAVSNTTYLIIGYR